MYIFTLYIPWKSRYGFLNSLSRNHGFPTTTVFHRMGFSESHVLPISQGWIFFFPVRWHRSAETTSQKPRNPAGALFSTSTCCKRTKRRKHPLKTYFPLQYGLTIAFVHIKQLFHFVVCGFQPGTLVEDKNTRARGNYSKQIHIWIHLSTNFAPQPLALEKPQWSSSGMWIFCNTSVGKWHRPLDVLVLGWAHIQNIVYVMMVGCCCFLNSTSVFCSNA